MTYTENDYFCFSEEMVSLLDVLTKAGCLILVILLGYILKRIGIFKKSDFPVFSHIVLDITLPCAIIINFTAFDFEPSLVSLVFVGIGCCVILAFAGWFFFRRSGAADSAFGMLNCSGYNIGCFTMPYVQSFLGPTAVVASCIFDVGNAVCSNGGIYGVASTLSHGNRFSLRSIGKKLTTSVPFITYITMLILALCSIPVPAPVLSFAEIGANANSFMAMMMLGVGFEISFERSYLSKVSRFLLIRYSISALLALFCYFVLPFSLEVRQVLTALVFSPVCSAAVAYTEKIDGDVGLAGAINSCSIIISVVIITCLLLVMGV